MARRVMHALRWGRRDASHGLLFTKKAFYEQNSTLLLWSGVPASSREKWCTSLNAYMLESGDNDAIQTPFGSILERIRSKDSDEQLLQGCAWSEQEPIWQAASDAVVWRSGDSLVRFLVNKPLSGHGTLRESTFFRAELPTLARYPPTEGLRVLNEHPVVKCHHLMPVIRNKIESNGLLDDWRKVRTFSCVDVLTFQQSSMNLTESGRKLLDSKATEFLKPGEQLESECDMKFSTLEGYKSCRDRGQIDFGIFQRIARQLPPEYAPEITSLRLPQLSKKLKQLPLMLPDILEMFDSSISLELCLWKSLETAQAQHSTVWFTRSLQKDFLPRDLEAACRKGAAKLLPGLLKALDDSRPPVRQAAAEVLGFIGNGNGAELAVPKLQALVKNFSSDEHVQIQAAKALGSIRREATEEVLPELVKALHDSDDAVRGRAAEALGFLGKEASGAVPELLKAMRNSTWALSKASHALGSIGKEAKEVVLPQLLDALDDSDTSVRKGAVSALGDMGEEAKEGAPKLMKALHDSDGTVRIYAAGALEKLGTEALGKLAKNVHHYEPWVREHALRALTSIGKEAKEAVPELVDALDDPHFEVRASAAQLLGSMGKEAVEAVPRLGKALVADRHYYVKNVAAFALSQIGKEAKEVVLPEFRKACGDSDNWVRIFSCNAMRFMGKQAKDAVPDLAKMLEDSEVDVRKAAAKALRSLGMEATEAVPNLLKALVDSDASVQALAALALGRMGHFTEAKESLLRELRNSLQDTDEEVRKRAALAVWEVAKEGPEEGTLTEAVPELTKALQDSDSSVRFYAAKALALMGQELDEAVPELLQELDDPQAEIRIHAAEAIGSIGKEADEVLHQLQKAAAGDPDSNVRGAALSALRALRGKVLTSTSPG
ncbi:mpeV [Symbiodinium sp. CCMP2456]|nr:mpeV [Symbiodinium sp. CCMP2456]